jgi:hypothetical protein
MVIKTLDPDRVIQPIMLYPDPDLESMNPDPKHCVRTVPVSTCEKPGPHSEVVPQEEDQSDGEQEKEQTNTQGSEQGRLLKIIIE